eukprot:759413-Hanusia_phi.AAC.2
MATSGQVCFSSQNLSKFQQSVIALLFDLFNTNVELDSEEFLGECHHPCCEQSIRRVQHMLMTHSRWGNDDIQETECTLAGTGQDGQTLVRLYDTVVHDPSVEFRHEEQTQSRVQDEMSDLSKSKAMAEVTDKNEEHSCDNSKEPRVRSILSPVDQNLLKSMPEHDSSTKSSAIGADNLVALSSHSHDHPRSRSSPPELQLYTQAPPLNPTPPPRERTGDAAPRRIWNGGRRRLEGEQEEQQEGTQFAFEQRASAGRDDPEHVDLLSFGGRVYLSTAKLSLNARVLQEDHVENAVTFFDEVHSRQIGGDKLSTCFPHFPLLSPYPYHSSLHPYPFAVPLPTFRSVCYILSDAVSALPIPPSSSHPTPCHPAPLVHLFLLLNYLQDWQISAGRAVEVMRYALSRSQKVLVCCPPQSFRCVHRIFDNLRNCFEFTEEEKGKLKLQEGPGGGSRQQQEQDDQGRE